MRYGAQFWKFCRLRQAAFWVRTWSGSPPYSNDPAIARYHFCNIYREADRGTVWFHEHRPSSFRGTLAASLIYRPINRLLTFVAYGGIPRLRDLPAFVKFMQHRLTRGERVFTGRHYTRGMPRYVKLADALPKELPRLAARIARARTGSMKRLCAMIADLPEIGDFFSWQIACDLIEAGVLPTAFRDGAERWVLLGPGARAGALIVDPDAAPLDTALKLRDTQPQDGSLAPPLQAPGPFSLKNVEHALCEFARWTRASSTAPTVLEIKRWAK